MGPVRHIDTFSTLDRGDDGFGHGHPLQAAGYQAILAFRLRRAGLRAQAPHAGEPKGSGLSHPPLARKLGCARNLDPKPLVTWNC